MGIFHYMTFNNSMLPALLCLKVGSPVILLRNLDPGEGLCNGTRMVVLNVKMSYDGK